LLQLVFVKFTFDNFIYFFKDHSQLQNPTGRLLKHLLIYTVIFS